jgi:predicted nuclease with TOPRIM domain
MGLAIDEVVCRAARLVDKAGELEYEADRVEEAARAIADEMHDLRRRFEGTEDALLRANRQLMKPVRCECPGCGKAFDVSRDAVKVNAVS